MGGIPTHYFSGDRNWTSTRPETAQANSMMDIGTRRIFSEEHDMFRENVRRFFQEEVLPHHPK
jgi:long-chain-acyl-CoA dehydrogenase